MAQRSPLLRFIRFILVLALGFALGFGWVWRGRLFNTPKIGENLPASWQAGSEILTERFRKKFPVGTDVSELIALLREQGFEPFWGFEEGKHNAFSYDFGFHCEQKWDVWWMVDKDEKITRIDTAYSNSCG